jgi:hypothetical protein
MMVLHFVTLSITRTASSILFPIACVLEPKPRVPVGSRALHTGNGPNEAGDVDAPAIRHEWNARVFIVTLLKVCRCEALA